MNITKEQLCLRYPFLKKTGIIHIGAEFNIAEMLQRWRGEKVLILMVGVQGSGKTTYCKEHFLEYPVINADEILIDFLEKNKETPFEEVAEKTNIIFLNKVDKALKTMGVAIIDAGAVHINFRVLLLEATHSKYTKVAMIVLNPKEGRIIRQIKKQLNIRARPGLWQDISSEYQLLQDQIKYHILEMGVDEVYML